MSPSDLNKAVDKQKARNTYVKLCATDKGLCMTVQNPKAGHALVAMAGALVGGCVVYKAMK